MNRHIPYPVHRRRYCHKPGRSSDLSSLFFKSSQVSQMTKYEELPFTAAGPFRTFTGFPIKSPMRRHSLTLLIYYAYDFNFKAYKNQYLLMQSTVYYNNLYRFSLIFKARVILNEKMQILKGKIFLKTFPLGAAMSKSVVKRRGLCNINVWREK